MRFSLQCKYLFVGLLKMLHKDGHHDIDEHKLRHQNKDDEKKRGKVAGEAAVLQTVAAIFWRLVALLTQRVLHYSIPIVT
jgi:hypothetical protein